MTKLRIFIHSLFKDKITSGINITGFSISISMALIMIAFLINEYGTDKYYPKMKRTYRIWRWFSGKAGEQLQEIRISISDMSSKKIARNII